MGIEEEGVEERERAVDGHREPVAHRAPNPARQDVARHAGVSLSGPQSVGQPGEEGACGGRRGPGKSRRDFGGSRGESRPGRGKGQEGRGPADEGPDVRGAGGQEIVDALTLRERVLEPGDPLEPGVADRTTDGAGLLPEPPQEHADGVGQSGGGRILAEGGVGVRAGAGFVADARGQWVAERGQRVFGGVRRGRLADRDGLKRGLKDPLMNGEDPHQHLIWERGRHHLEVREAEEAGVAVRGGVGGILQKSGQPKGAPRGGLVPVPAGRADLRGRDAGGETPSASGARPGGQVGAEVADHHLVDVPELRGPARGLGELVPVNEAESQGPRQGRRGRGPGVVLVEEPEEVLPVHLLQLSADGTPRLAESLQEAEFLVDAGGSPGGPRSPRRACRRRTGTLRTRGCTGAAKELHRRRRVRNKNTPTGTLPLEAITRLHPGV